MPYNFTEIPEEKWPTHSKRLMRVLKSKKFLVQIWKDAGFLRISINRQDYILKDEKPIWKDGITWDELQAIKDAIGYADHWCVECYPPKNSIVNDANFRHLWLLEEAPEFGWHK
jgi:hypothetical protein